MKVVYSCLNFHYCYCCLARAVAFLTWRIRSPGLGCGTDKSYKKTGSPGSVSVGNHGLKGVTRLNKYSPSKSLSWQGQ